jgi:magnesium transporter
MKTKPSKLEALPTSTLAVNTHPAINLIDFDAQQYTATDITDIADCIPFIHAPTVTWINVDNVHTPVLVEQIGVQFNFHPLMLEDIKHTEQRPKYEEYDDCIFIVLKMLDFNLHTHAITIEQLSLVLAPHYLISFQEQAGDVFGSVRERISKSGSRIRKAASDYTVYALMDAVVDRYFDVLEHLGNKIETLEAVLAKNPKTDTLRSIHKLRRELIFLRKAVWPLRDVVAAMQRAESPLIHDNTELYLRDLHDHVIRVTDSIDTYRDMLSSMQDVYLSSLSNRTNEIMKVLTLFSSIFLPLTLLAGIFGMNFHNFPGLDANNGLFITLLTMLLLGIGMVLFFKHKRWI